MSLLLLNEDELRQTINLSEAVAVIEAAFLASVENKIKSPGSFTLALPEVQGQVMIKSTYLPEAPYYVIKIDNHFKNNPPINLPVNNELIVVFDAATGYPAAILLDNGYLTNVRIGVVGALATEYLANKQARTVTMLGSSGQAYVQLKALVTHRSVERVIVWSPLPHETDGFARRLVEDHDVNVEIAPSTEAAVAETDIIITAIHSPHPILRAEWLKPGVHITAIGGGNATPDHQLHPDVLARADVIVVDSLEHCTDYGEVQHAIASGSITAAKIQGELGSLIQGKLTGRTRSDQITVADLAGLDWQDTVIATLALDKALFLGLGQRLESGLEQTHLRQGASIRL